MSRYGEALREKLRCYPWPSLLELSGAEVEEARGRLRERLLADVLGIAAREAVRGVMVEETAHEHYRRQSLLIRGGTWQTAQLYLPVNPGRYPGVLLASGHGGSKAHGYNQMAAQLYAQMGCVVLVGDPIGEEERHEPYGLGMRGHRRDYIVDRMNEAGRSFLGKVIEDLRAGLDYLRGHDEVDAERIGCAGSSMGGTLVQLLVAAEPGIRAAVLSSWAADYCCLDGAIGCCYRLPGLVHIGHQLELMAMAAPECALLVCAGAEDNVTPPHGLREMGERLEQWWEQRGGGGRFACRIEEKGGHRPYHLTPEGMQWMADHLQIPTETRIDTLPVRTIGEIYRAAGKALEPLYDKERHHQGTRLPAWPLTLESPEALRVATTEVLERYGVDREKLTLQGFLEAEGIPPLHQVLPIPPDLPPTPEAAARRVEAALRELAPEPKGWATSAGEWVREGESDWSIDLGFAGRRLRIFGEREGANSGELLLAREPSAIEGFGAAVDLVAFNDHETLLNEPSLFTNLYLVQRAMALLETRYGSAVTWSITSVVPRLGELAFFRLPSLYHLTITAGHAVEPARAGTGRAENIVPRSAGKLEWLDLLLASVPRGVTLHHSYLHPEARALLSSFPSFKFC